MHDPKPIKIAPINDNEYISHIESFDFIYREKNYLIRFAHKCHGQDIHKVLYFRRFYSFFSKISKHIAPGDTVVDFGAYDGDTSIAMALAAEHGKCISFEPSLAFCYGLQINVALNPFLNVEAYNVAATDKDGMANFNYSPTEEVGGHPLNTTRIGTYTRKRSVRTIDLRKWYDKLKDITFIKSDTEGFDVEIMKLLLPVIEKNQPVIHIEWYPNTSGPLSAFIDHMKYKAMDFKTGQIYDGLPPVWTDDLLLAPPNKL